MKTFLDIDAALEFIEKALVHYGEKAPGDFTGWLNDLYDRLYEGSERGKVTVDELWSLAWLYDQEGGWIGEHFAVSTMYKLYDRLKRPTTGMAGF